MRPMSEASPGILASIRWPRPFAGLQGVTLADVPREVSAGVTLAALMIPLNIGYAQVAGLPPAAGLYAAIIPLVVFALLASSRHLVTSPDASMARLVGAALVAFAAPGDPLRLQYALALAVLCAVLFFVFWIFRLAFLANFLSRAVMAGFITGLGDRGVHQPGAEDPRRSPRRATPASGVLAAAEQLKETMATSVKTEGYFVEVIALVQSIPRANLYSVAIGVGAFLIVRLMKRYAPKIPGALVALVLLTALVALLRPRRQGRRRARKRDPLGLPDADPARDSRSPTTCGCCRAPWRSWPSSSAKACSWSAATATSTATRRTATRCSSPRARPTWRPASPGRSSRATAPPARRRWTPRARRASCPAWWRP